VLRLLRVRTGLHNGLASRADVTVVTISDHFQLDGGKLFYD